MSNVVGINKHPNFTTKAGRAFDLFVKALDSAMLPKQAGPIDLTAKPDPKQINFLKIGRTEEEYREVVVQLAQRNEWEKNHE
jgi:hypothetical protein